MNETIELRHTLHKHPELSGYEVNTAQRIIEFFEALQPDSVLQGLGGTGVAFVYNAEKPGPTLLLRCDLDAVPVNELNEMEYKSTVPGVSHQCGHDGHMAIIAAVGQWLSCHQLKCGRVVLLYQPAEETGAGAQAVISDPKYSQILPDYVFALHNLPGFPMGQVVLREGVFCCASRGLSIQLNGKTAHAAQPETGVSPAQAMCRIIELLSHLPAELSDPNELAFATVVGSKLGEKAFGTAPGKAEVWVTLRSETDATMANIMEYVECQVKQLSLDLGLEHLMSYHDVFTATVNSAKAIRLINKSATNMDVVNVNEPFRWSEDFGQFTALTEGALFGLGSGDRTPHLHNPDYDFPDELVAVGASIFQNIIKDNLGVF